MSGAELLLAIDAGGSSTRAVLVTPDAVCHGFGTGAAGNPTSAGARAATAAMAAAAAGAAHQAGVGLVDVRAVVVAMAGVRAALDPLELAVALGATSSPALAVTMSDVAATYFSGALEPSGAVVVAGTGSCAAQVRDGRVVRSVGGSGWLLGDGGSGFAVGHAVVRAVVAHLDGTGPPTALTPLLLGSLGLAEPEVASADGRPAVLDALVDRCYDDRPVALARHAPLAVADAQDPVAAAIVAGAQDALATLVTAVRGVAREPLVLGGGMVAGGLLAPEGVRSAALHRALEGADVRLVHDGTVGAAVLGLTAQGRVLDEGAHERLRASVESLRAV